MVALSPFAGLGDLAGDPTGFAVARVAWTALGGISAVLVWSTLRAAYPVGAVVGAVFFAIYFPAVLGNHTIQPEGLATVLVLIAVRLLTRSKPFPTTVMLLLAGAALGASDAVKIWGVVGIAVVVWVLVTSGVRRAPDSDRRVRSGGRGALSAVLPRRPRRHVADGRGRPPGPLRRTHSRGSVSWSGCPSCTG